jgi:hypothetical protein
MFVSSPQVLILQEIMYDIFYNIFFNIPIRKDFFLPLSWTIILLNLNSNNDIMIFLMVF